MTTMTETADEQVEQATGRSRGGKRRMANLAMVGALSVGGLMVGTAAAEVAIDAAPAADAAGYTSSTHGDCSRSSQYPSAARRRTCVIQVRQSLERSPRIFNVRNCYSSVTRWNGKWVLRAICTAYFRR